MVKGRLLAQGNAFRSKRYACATIEGIVPNATASHATLKALRAQRQKGALAPHALLFVILRRILLRVFLRVFLRVLRRILILTLRLVVLIHSLLLEVVAPGHDPVGVDGRPTGGTHHLRMLVA